MLILFLILSGKSTDVKSSIPSQKDKPSTEAMEKQKPEIQGIGNSVHNLFSTDQLIHHGLYFALKSRN